MLQVIFDKNNVCSRCGKDQTKAMGLLGNQAFTIHSELHYREDVQTYIEVAYELAKVCKQAGFKMEILKILRDLDPEAYARRVTGKQEAINNEKS